MDHSSRWSEIQPVREFVDVLNGLGDYTAQKTTDEKRDWGKAFADRCALMIANGFRKRKAFRDYQIRPNPDGSGTEALTGVGGAEDKKVDVLVSSLASGLQVAVSLKAENYPSAGGKFGKNWLNRSYEFSDEVRSIHLYQPRAVAVGAFFLPLDACWDRKRRSSFHRAIEILRARTGRADRSAPTQLYKADLGYIALYTARDLTLPDGKTAHRGVVRFCSCVSGAPRVGRPRVGSTFTLKEVVDRIESYYVEGLEQPIADAPPEEDTPQA